MAAEDGGVSVGHERARRAVFGFLAPAVLHETNNVLTVMAGVRQLLRAGQTLSERVGTMIDQQLGRMEELVGSIRRIGPEDVEPTHRPREVSFVVEAIERVIQIAAKGRGVTLDREKSASDGRPGDPEALALASLCVVLPLLPSRGRSAGGAHVTLCGSATPSATQVEITMSAIEGDPAHEPEVDVARALIAHVGGRFECSAANGGLHAIVAVPRSSAPGQ